MSIRIGEKDYSIEDIAALKELAAAFKNDPASATPTATPLYGPYPTGTNLGVFSVPGIRPEMFSAFQRPRSLAQIIGVRRSVYTHDKIGIMTGATADTGSNAEDFCGNPPIAGHLKRCVQDYVFGKWYMKTKLNVLPEMGEWVDRADMEKRLMNIAATQNPFMPEDMTRLDLSNRAGLQLANELFNLGVAFERRTETVLVQGNHALLPAATERGWFNEFDGLELQITTGKVDMNTLVACPAADSVVVTWNAQIDATVSGRTLPMVIVDTMFGLNDRARQVGMDGTQFGIVMPMRMFRALTYVYACSYWTSRCAGTATEPQNVDAAETRRLQLEMLQGQFLLIDGQAYPVYFSDGIAETRVAANMYTASEMFILPLSWQGMSLLNLYYKPMDNEDIIAFDGYGGLETVRSINNGMFLVGKRTTGFCPELLFASKMRLIQDAPFLAARIDGITYTYQAPYRSAYPESTVDYVNGGASYWTG